MLKKSLIFILSLITFISLIPTIKVKAVEAHFDVLTNDVSYDLTSNYFAQKDTYDDVHSKSIDYFLDVNNFKDESGNVTRLYALAAENNKLALYVSEESLNIAVLVKDTGYVFYTNPEYYQWDIEAYYVTGKLNTN